MAGDWIKIEESMPEKPEVAEIAEILGIDDPDTVAGKLIRVWAWATRNCNGDGVTTVTAMKQIDRCAGVTGFAKSMLKAGWLDTSNGCLTFPNFDRHISQTAKERALTSKRVARHRGNSGNGESVTKTLPEKRREEKKEKDGVAPIGFEVAVSYGSQIGMTKEQVENWWNIRSRDGWTIAGSNGITRPVQSWQHDLATAKSWKSATRETTAQKKRPTMADEFGI